MAVLRIKSPFLLQVALREWSCGFKANIIVEDIKEYTPFNIEFEYLQEYDRTAKYKFAIICSSSKDGDLFKGAGGSTLIVDEFEVICE